MLILAVCGMGIGTSIVLQANAEKAAQQLGLDAVVEVTDLQAARADAARADVVLTSTELAAELGDVGVPVVTIANFLDTSEIEAGLARAVPPPSNQPPDPV